MTTLDKTTHDHRKMEATLAQDSRIHSLASKVGRFLLHLLEMLLAMGAGMGVFHLLVRLIPASTRYAKAFEPGTDLHAIAMMVFMTVPMAAWMIIRGHGWRHSAEMAVAMLTPTAVIFLLCQLGALEFLPWLAEASGPAMFLGMLAAMLYRRNHYTVKAGHLIHAA